MTEPTRDPDNLTLKHHGQGKKTNTHTHTHTHTHRERGSMIGVLTSAYDARGFNRLRVDIFTNVF